MSLHPSDMNDLRKAKNLLENPGIAARITNMLGYLIEKGIALLPNSWNVKIGEAAQDALHEALQVAVFTMEDKPGEESSNIWHKLAVAASGVFGGLFGISALAVELPVSTTIMLRSIADIARSEGESISELESRMACIEVFALGGTSKNNDVSKSGYFAIRSALAGAVSEAAEYIMEKGIVEEGAPALLRMIIQIAERYSIQVTEKMAAQMIPVIGAAGGAVINTVFIDHFQDMARGHFIVRRLERKYGEDDVRETYYSIII